LSRAELREMWEGRIASFRASGQSAPAWCNEHGVNIHTLRYWLQKTSSSRKSEPTVPVRWLSVEVAEDGGGQPMSQGKIAICIGDARVEVEPGCNLIFLREVVQTLATLC
jgi:hypothetical protein